MPATNYKFDVAISFSGKDRDIARAIVAAIEEKRITVFYDETARAELWGRDLFQHLAEIYATHAQYVIILFSRHYPTSRWTTLEYKSASDTGQKLNREYILPIHLDDSEMPDPVARLGGIEYSRSDPATIARMLQEKIRSTSTAIRPATRRKRISAPAMVEGFSWLPATLGLSITEPEITDRLDEIWADANPKLRFLFARDLGRLVYFSSPQSFGPIHTAWRINTKVSLSTLPGVVSYFDGMTTFEFEIFGERERKLVLVGEWKSNRADLSTFTHDEFHNAVRGIGADRNGCDMLRESTLLALKKRGTQFGFPLSPGKSMEPLCGWVKGEPESLLLDWDRNPKLVKPQVSIWDSLFYEEAEVGVLLFVVCGGWSNAALYCFENYLERLLPARYIRSPLVNGAMRVCVHVYDDEKESVGMLWPVVDRVHFIIAMMEAVQNEIPVDIPVTARGLPPLENPSRSMLQEAVQSLGGRQYPEKVKELWDRDNKGWVKLHHLAERDMLQQSIPRFDPSYMVTRRQILEYIKVMITTKLD
jgi:hypothetical protein